jgi:hypothetical protein
MNKKDYEVNTITTSYIGLYWLYSLIVPLIMMTAVIYSLCRVTASRSWCCSPHDRRFFPKKHAASMRGKSGMVSSKLTSP